MRLTNSINYISLLRVQQWVKNGFIFLPMFFDKQFMNGSNLWVASIAFISFSFTASAIYCINDIIDLPYDKLHAKKKHRPIAKGVVSVLEAKCIALFCVLLSWVIAITCISKAFLVVLIGYFILNISYALKLKKIIIIDVVVIAISFVLRLVAGGIATQTELSIWIIIMVALLALYLGFSKRKNEFEIFTNTKVLVRVNINKYSLSLLRKILNSIFVSIIVLYIMYSLSPQIKNQYQSNYIWLTSVFVIMGLLRYNKLIKQKNNYGNPTQIILRDFKLQCIVLGWLVSFYLIIYR